jgi:general secretion pathway protein H
MKAKMKNNRGFSLIELLIIIMIIGVLAAVAVPRIGSGEKSAYSSARQIVADLRYTRTLAVTTGQKHYLKLLPAGGPYTSYEIYKDEVSPTDDVKVGDTRIISGKVTCTSTLEELKFTYLGIGFAGDGLITINDGTNTFGVSVTASTGRIYQYKI